MDRQRIKETVAKALLLLAAVGATFLLIEAVMRWNFYSKSPTTGPAQLRLYRGIARAWKLRGVSGLELNKMAWEASYTERGQKVPPVGPREGYWGERTRPQNRPCGDLVACERTQTIPLLVTIDGRGFQHVGGGADAFPRILFLGSSVAFGSYASTLENAYFSQLLRLLHPEFPELGISVFGVNGSVGMEDYEAYALRGGEVDPDMVIFLNGMNDLTNRPNQRPDEGLRQYRKSVKLATQLGQLQGVKVVFAMQPFLGSKVRKSSLERRLLDLTLDDYENKLNPWYRRLAHETQELAGRGGAAFLDYSDVLAEEEATTFADQWHFSDFGHTLLAQALARDLPPLLQELEQSSEPE